MLPSRSDSATFLFVGGMLINPVNYKPFAPLGFAGIVTGGAIVFFTYIGFDSVSTAAEECRNPQRDLPFGIIASLIICTVLYIGVAIVLLGIMKYSTFGSGRAAEAPVAYALQQLGAHPIFRSVIVIGALMGMISTLMVFQYGQARIWYAMSRDRLLPKLFSAVHSKFNRGQEKSRYVIGVSPDIHTTNFLADNQQHGRHRALEKP
jgi:APA family basic amino acid/polyamine antiporter